MFEWLWRFFAGWVCVSVPAECRAVLMTLFLEQEIPFWHEKTIHDSVLVRIPLRMLASFAEAAEACCLTYTVCRTGGLPKILAFCRRRPGLVLGGAVLLAWCLYSQNIIWNIEIEGCENLTPQYIEEVLTENGCGIGDYYPAVDFDALHASVRAGDPDIAWLSVYMNGTTAEVQLRETKHPTGQSHAPDTYANVVASEAGEVVIAQVIEGQAVVTEGDVVLPGELLISGMVSMKEEGQTRLEYASGEVLARVACPISVEVNLNRQEKVYTGREKTEKSIKIFKKNINLFGNTGIPYATYDTIDMMEQVCLFGVWSIPVTVYTTVYREYEMADVRIEADLAAEEAMAALRVKMDEAIGEGELLSRTVTVTTAEDGGCRIDCLLYLLRDIARTVEFTVTPETYTATP